jgi:hypothetical protein
MYRVGSALRADLVVFGFSGKRLALRPPHGGRRVGAGLRHALGVFVSLPHLAVTDWVGMTGPVILGE